ncbi:MAG TPA: hypothetical protein VFJ00_00105, partial [Candidatus Limnocylindria bacterium]|nr:hypothetical protein [Candidatus Limnocylindria bacterium]
GASSAEPHEWSITMTRTQPSRRILGALVLVAGIALVGCTTGSPSQSSAGSSGSPIASAGIESSVPASSVEPSASATSDEPTESLPAFACVPSVTIASTTDRAQITDVRVGTHDGYDRVVFEFDSGLPNAVIEGVLPPFYADASGLEIEVAGSAFLQVRMNFASKVSPDGVTTYDGPTSFEPEFDRLVHLLEGGDFEAVSTWYLGLDGGSCFRVLTLSDPSRLVIDIEH